MHTTNFTAPSFWRGTPSGLATSEAALLADLKKQLDKAVTQAGKDPFGFGFLWNTYDTTSHGGGLVIMANEYDNLTSSTAYAAHGSRWQANVLGANAWGTSLIIGDGGTFPLCMQHQVTNLVPVQPNGPPFLLGAAVEGPNSFAARGTLTGMVACPPNGVDGFVQFTGNGAVFQDNVQSTQPWNRPSISRGPRFLDSRGKSPERRRELRKVPVEERSWLSMPSTSSPGCGTESLRRCAWVGEATRLPGRRRCGLL